MASQSVSEPLPGTYDQPAPTGTHPQRKWQSLSDTLRRKPMRLASILALILCMAGIGWWLSPTQPAGKPMPLREYVSTLKLEYALKQNMDALLAQPAAMKQFLPQPLRVANLSTPFYQEGNSLVWVRPGGLTQLGRQMHTRLQQAGEVGLMPRDYHIPVLDSLVASLDSQPTPDTYLRAEFLLTDAFFLYTRHLRTGKLDSTAWMPFWQVPGTDTSLNYTELLRTLQRNDQPLDSVYAQWEPIHPEYRQLRQAMRTHLAWQKEGIRWPAVPAITKLEPGQSHPAVPQIRRRLRATADLSADADTLSTLMDSTLVQAIKRFQLRHGRNADGIIGMGTVAAMNVPLAYRIEQLRLNLARWHWQPRNWGDRHIWVNIPEARMRMYEQDKLTQDMRVVVGRKKRRTPFISSTGIDHLVFNPYWNVPGKMIEEDILPQMRRNPAYLANMRMQLIDASGTPVHMDSTTLAGYGDKDFPYMVRQDPGWGNSLGRVLFMFPNNWSVYLHDSPDRWLFYTEERALSSGCIRLEHPMDMADYLLKDIPGWTQEKRIKMMDEKDPQTGQLKRQHVALPKPIPVHLYYHTARADAQGNAWFFDDPYEIDEKRLRILWAQHPSIY